MATDTMGTTIMLAHPSPEIWELCLIVSEALTDTVGEHFI